MKIDLFNKYPTFYWSNKTKLEYLQRRIIIYSIMYYEYDESCVSDEYYNTLSQTLLKMFSEVNRDIIKKTAYYYCFKDFDGSTGFDLYSRLNKKDKEYLTQLSNNIYKKWQIEMKGKILK